MYAVIITGGKQYKVSEGDVIYVEKIEANDGDNVVFDNVIAVVDGDNVTFGTPNVAGAVVNAKVIKQGKSAKVRIFKYKAKKTYRNRKGHRQPYTKIQIESVAV